MKHEPPVLLIVFLTLLGMISGCAALPAATQAPPGATEAPQPTLAALAIATPPGSGDQQGAPLNPLSRCPMVDEGLQRLVVPEGLYCLAYPAEYKVEKPVAGETLLVIGGLLDAANPRVQITVTDAAGATAETAADHLVAEFKDFTLERSTRTVAGEMAVVLDKVPGQDINRRVLFVHGNLLYDIMFAPADSAQGDVYTRMNTLTEQVLGSFTFLPSGFGMADDCLTPTTGTQLHKDPTRGYCLLYPAGYSVQQTDANEATIYSGSLMDVSRPKLFVRVEDANGQTASQIADALVAEVRQSVPGQPIDRPFGVTLGYEVAERLDNVPGQDLGRVLIAVHGPRAYRLTFVPADSSDAAMLQQTEALYALILRSFRFTD